MTFRIELTHSAELDLVDALDFIASGSRLKAIQWRDEFWLVVGSLREMPFRFTGIPESAAMRISYRATLHYSHRIIYRVDEESATVYIVRIYHEGRRPWSQADLSS